MACPFFYPLSPKCENTGVPGPLGECWDGSCHAPDGPSDPDPEALRPLCNMGYARGRCRRFPAGRVPDAVRFAVKADDGATIRIYYSVEMDHLPFAHGPMEYSLAGGALANPPEDPVLARQAVAYVESYLRRKRRSRAEA